MPQMLKPLLPEALLNWIAFVVVVIVSVACSQEDPFALELRADAERTTAGGFPITLSVAHLPSSGEVTWLINPHSPGKLDSSVGDTVRYLPPGAGAITEEREVEVMAFADGRSANLTLHLLPSDWSSVIANMATSDDLALLDR